MGSARFLLFGFFHDIFLSKQIYCWEKSEWNEIEWGQNELMIDEGVDPWIYTQGKGV
jgi:hypothetical protein